MKTSSWLSILTVISASALLAAVTASAATEARTESSAAVAKAEQIIMEAGKSTPVDSTKVENAMDELRHAIDLDPHNDAAFVDLGFCYGLLRDPDQAIQAYTTATRLNPSPGNFKELADIYLRAGDPEQALMAANAGISKDPKNAPLYNAKGMALADLVRPDEAEIAFRKALVLDPNFKIAKENLDALTAKRLKTSSISR